MRMKLNLFMALALGCSAMAMAAESPAEKAAREAQNFDVLMKHYPARALANREQGAVGFRLTLDHAGDPTACVITRSSGFALLDNETCDLLILYARYQPEAGISRSSVITHDGSISWTLPNSPEFVMAPPAQIAIVADPLDKKICKKALRIGTLADYERTCRTKREWAAETDAMKKNWQDIQGSWGTTHGKD